MYIYIYMNIVMKFNKSHHLGKQTILNQWYDDCVAIESNTSVSIRLSENMSVQQPNVKKTSVPKTGIYK